MPPAASGVLRTLIHGLLPTQALDFCGARLEACTLPLQASHQARASFLLLSNCKLEIGIAW